jgi:hypothetical protein
MLRLSETYTGCDTFWLHRPSHKRYKAGKAFEAQLKESLDLLVDSKADAEVVKNEKTEATEKVSKGETHKVTQTKKIETTVWYKLRRKDGVEGWVPASKCKAMTNDRPIAVNAGTFGMPGVAYSFGCKDRPGEYNQLLDGNALKPDKIKTWQQYEKRHKPGKTSGDSDTINWTGVDCSGFTQNCVTDSLLSDNTRIVPQSRLKRIIRKPIGSEGNWAYSATCVPARKFVGDYARQIPYHADDPDKQWLDITDLITSEGHIVWVTEESPDAAENQRDFEVANAYGGYTRKNQKPKLPTDKFIRKVIRMPFKWWGIYCGGNGIKLGRIYFWS